jgi:hypothetical protein
MAEMNRSRSDDDASGSSPARSRGRSLLGFVEWGMLALVIAAGMVAWGVGIVHRDYDYDEVQRAHSVWLSSRGLRPYVEMFEVHPPYFVLLTPILRGRTDPCDVLRALRLFGAVGNLLFLGGLVALGWTSMTRGGRWAWLGLAYVAFHPKVLDYLVEFRIDGWGSALAAWSLVVFLRRPLARWRFATFGVLSGIATLFLCPKLAILPPLVVGFELVRVRPSARVAVRSCAAYGFGLGIAGLGFALYLAANRIALDRTYLLLFRYHTLSNAHSSYRNGLLRQIVGTPLLLAPIVLGAFAWVWDVVKRRSFADAYPPALGAWLVIQSLMVAYHYKQYYAPWFLFASAFVILLGRALDALWRPLGALAFVAACGITIVPALGIAQLWDRYSPARGHCALIRALNVLAGPEDRVVAPPPAHPIGRRDVFFLWFNTSDPEGYDSERILESLPPYRSLVSPEQNQAALQAHPPAFVILDSGPFAAPYPEGQWKALLEFLPRHGYRVVRLGGQRLALRPDRFARLRGGGLFEEEGGPLAPVMPRAK